MIITRTPYRVSFFGGGTDLPIWFKDHGGMTRENGQRLRDLVLARGGSKPADAMYRAFRGRDPQVGPLLIERGLSTKPGQEPPR